MDNLRWILIFAGVAILVLLYLSGRQSNSSRRQRQSDSLENTTDAHSFDAPEQADPLMGDQSFAEPLDSFGEDTGFDDPLERPGGQRSTARQRGDVQPSGLSGISSKIEAFGSKLAPNRRARVAEQKPKASATDPNFASKIVTLHVVAPEGELMNGGLLLEQFEQRNYHFGDMNIFHSMHEGKTVFSVAKLVMPGTFDINDIDSFQTPGISLILQLPGPIPADVAFDVLLSEAWEISVALGANVLDADRSTLSNQTVQHMKEGIYEYMHRQKYFSKAPS